MLKDWFLSHSVHPYPTEDEKAQLSATTGMTIRQVSYWFVNARRRNLSKTDKDSENGGDAQNPGALPIARSGPSTPWNDMPPLDRWRHSPPEEEPASWHAISQSLGRYKEASSSEPETGQAGVPAYIDSSDTSKSSASSGSSAHSYVSESLLSLQSHGSRRRRRRRAVARNKRAATSAESERRLFQCTFCTDTFQTRYDWTRHEGTVHLILEKWTCLLFGPQYRDPFEEMMRCSLCDEANPTAEHLERHRSADCVSKPEDRRSFFRRDHLRQHLRSSHGVSDMLPSMKRWTSRVTRIKCRCGFCAETFASWPDRNDHLAEHFRAGAQMKDWRGCRGLEPAVALMVQNAIPPYLIGTESNDVEPFSGSRAALRGARDGAIPPTRFESLTARLGVWVGEARATGASITDEELRREARIFLYGDDDPLNHTPADNEEWLDLFKQGYGLASYLGRHGSPSSTRQLLAGQDAVSLQAATMPFTPERMRWAAVPDSTVLPAVFCGNSTQDEVSQGMAIPWSWQTPECLMEFSQMGQVPRADGMLLSGDMVDATTPADPGHCPPALPEHGPGTIGQSARRPGPHAASEGPPGEQLDELWMDMLVQDDDLASLEW